jgi:single-strand DNA-binding protein
MSVLVVTGRIGSDAEKRSLQSGKAVVSFSVADQQGWGDNKHTLWIKCAMFGERAEKLLPYLTKGSLVEVVGTPSVEAWLKKGDNTAQAALKLTVSEVKLHGSIKGEDKPVADKGRATAGQGPSAPFDDDIPFAAEWR